jgi:CubicO group peptidase (beta-lactamase class C family)
MNISRRKMILSVITISFMFFSLFSCYGHMISSNSRNNNEVIEDSFLNSLKINQNENETDGFIDPQNVSDFITDFINEQMPQVFPFPVAGGAISIVKDGEMFLAEGFGYANLANNVLVSANETLFRVGSISKTVIATAVLQLVEDGLLDLNADINSYLTTFKIPDTFKDPITLIDLLTHTAGFESTSYLSTSTDPSEIPSLEEVLNDSMPNRIRPVGEASSYSNYGAALAGYIVEQISGTSFETYVEENILAPLGMNHSTFNQPLSTHLLSNLSTSFGVNLAPAPFQYITLYPGDSLSSTPTDMAKFMIALLDNGSGVGNSILEYESILNMREGHFKWHPSVSGVTLGMYHMDNLNQSIIGHTGNINYFNSHMALIPDENIGVFITSNTQNSLNAIGYLFYSLLNEYYPYTYVNSTDAIIEPMDNHRSRVSRYTGSYIFNQRYFSAVGDSADQFEILSSGGNIRIDEYEGLAFVEVEPLIFRETSGTYDLKIVFGTDKSGHVSRMYLSWFDPIYGFDKIHHWYEPLELQMFLIAFLTILILSSLVVWAYIAFVKFDSQVKPEKMPSRLVRWYILPVYIITQLFLFTYNARMNSRIITVFEIPIVFADMSFLILLMSIMILALFPLVLLVWWGKGNYDGKPYWTRKARIHYTLIAISFLGFFWLLDYWFFI